MNATNWIGPREAAEILGVTHRTVQNWLDQGRIKHWRTPVGGHRRMAREDVEGFLAKALKGKEFRDSHRGDPGDTVRESEVRRAFEVHIAAPGGMSTALDGRGQYDSYNTRAAWDIWQAATTWRMAVFKRRRLHVEGKGTAS